MKCCIMKNRVQNCIIKEKENAATEAKYAFEDATEGETESYRIMAKETLERCQELVQKLK